MLCVCFSRLAVLMEHSKMLIALAIVGPLFGQRLELYGLSIANRDIFIPKADEILRSHFSTIIFGVQQHLLDKKSVDW